LGLQVLITESWYHTVLLGIGIGIAGLSAHLGGNLIAAAFGVDELVPLCSDLLRCGGGHRVDRRSDLAQGVADQYLVLPGRDRF
jgi:hypothetical protein